MGYITYLLSGTVRRFLENHGESIEAVVFAVSDTEEVCSISYQLVQKITSLAHAVCIHDVQTQIGLIFILEVFVENRFELLCLH